ncbi:putative uncharacterized protein [Pseudomonas sp. St290]|nr:putative uncharacterized protein [Pseudomonas sp. St290]
MNEDADTVTREYDIGFAWKISLMQAIPEALPMKQLPDLHLWQCIAAADARHHSRPDFSADYVHEQPPDELAPIAGYLLGKTFPLCEPIQIVDFFVGPGAGRRLCHIRQW